MTESLGPRLLSNIESVSITDPGPADRRRRWVWRQIVVHWLNDVAGLGPVWCHSAGGLTLSLSPGIEFRHLRYFLAVYDELHFGRAADRLHIAQPPLSQAIRKLETELGAQLLERTSRAVRPTAAGHVFADEARKVLTSLDFAVTETQRVGRGSAAIRVGCVTYVPSRRLQDFLSELRGRDNALRAEVIHLLGLEQVGRLRAGDLDLGVFAHAEDYEGLDWVRLFPGEYLNAFLPESHELASRPVLTPGDFWSETLLTYPRSANPVFYDSVSRLLEDSGYRFARRHETNTDPLDVFHAVAGGLGVALAPVSFEAMSLVVARELVSVPLDPPLQYPDTIVAWRADPPRDLASRLGAVREAASELFRTTSLQHPVGPGPAVAG
jgi:DNA-binding transcriptional LysR family regulator